MKIDAAPAKTVLAASLRALRYWQWTKNLLIFAPLLLAHRFTDLSAWSNAWIGFATFSLTASAVYVANDLADLSADRAHPRKRFRPFASGLLRPRQGSFMIVTLLAGAVLLSLLLPWPSLALLIIYGLGAWLYSVWMKRLLLIDAVMLSLFYCLRLIYGGAVTQITISVWTLTFSIFFFLSLALAKRVAELRLSFDGEEMARRQRAYRTEDLTVLTAIGIALGCCAALVVPLYIQDPMHQASYQRPWILLLGCPILLIWLGRMWLLAGRGELVDDPLVYAATDKASLILASLLIPIFVAAL